MRHWPPGQQLHQGKYLIEEILGGGGFGVTYRAQNRKEGKVVAIKTLNANVQGKPNFREFQTKFVNEALSLARCSHPHVVQVYEVFPEMVGNIELWCMVMELIDGIDLASHLEDNGLLSEAKALPIIQEVGSALSFVHQQGFTHLDVKPQNIMLRTPPSPPLVRGGVRENTPFSSSPLNKGGQGGAVLIDFGIARQVTAPGKLRTNSNSGTECYAPIELLERRAELGAYTDVYSLAATLYVMLTGELPFPSQFRKQNIPLTPPKQFKSEISDRVNVAIMKGMELEPQNRPQSVQEWLDLLVPKPGVLPSPKVSPQPAQKSFETPQKPAPPDTARVISVVGINYINLQNLLAAQKWQEADEETWRVMLKVAGREQEGWLGPESIEKFPCEDLRTIDQLWLKYSDGRFGFSVQKRIYSSLRRTREYHEWVNFCDRVGWRKNNQCLYYTDLIFSEKAPEAHLPAAWCRSKAGEVRGSGWMWWFFSRVETCKV
ncbi:serine/threonine-protein kinase [Microcoleus sp. MON1_C5]|uniref:serine/threonine-protein kinase n=1 Tax=Microcoleus sp. MON1_C5 TaxID=2818828 RepID=UPI002FCEC438